MKKYIVIGILLLCSILFSVQKVIKVEIETQYDANTEYQLFYTTSSEDKFSEYDSLTFSSKPGSTKNKIYIKEPKIYEIRLDFQSGVKNLKIDRFAVQGQKLDNTKFIRSSHVEEYSTNENYISVSSSKQDPYIVYSEKLNNIGGAYTIDYERAILLFLIGLYIFWLVTSREEDNSILKTVEGSKSVVTAKIHNLGFLRILFAISVVCTHFFGLLNIQKTGGSVEFFFILSGFFLAYTFKPEKTYISYIKKRFIQFAPLVVFGTLLCGGGLASLKGALFLQNTGLAFGDLLNVPAWYIGVLFWISLFYFALLKSVSDKSKLYFIIGTIVFIASVICANAPGVKLEPVLGFFPKGLFRGLACVGTGILLQSVTKVENQKANIWYTVLEACFIILTVLALFYYPMSFSYWIYRVICWSVLIYLFLSRKGYITKALDRPIFSKMSSFCLAIFLTHWFVVDAKYGTIWFIKEYAPEWLKEEKGLVIILVLLSSVVVAVFAHYFVEKPCAKLLKKVLK